MRRCLLPLVAAALLLAACSGGGSSSPAAPAASAGAAANPDAPEALQLDAPLVGGGTLDLTSFAGTTVALWFWAPT